MGRPALSSSVGGRQLDALCSLDDPSSRRLYDYVVAQAEPVTRDRQRGPRHRSVHGRLSPRPARRQGAARHDKGLLATSFARPQGRGGPGAGRPAKPAEYQTPAIEDRAVAVQLLLADHGHHRAASVPDLVVAATAELAGLTVLRVDKDFDLIAAVTGQPTQRLE